MAWKRLERLTRSADVTVPEPAAASDRDGGALDPVAKPDKNDEAEESTKATGGKAPETRSSSSRKAKPADKGEVPGKAKTKTKTKTKTTKRTDSALDVPAEEVDRLVDEGMLIVRSALRMSAKNRLIMQVLGAGETFDEDALIEEVRADARSLAEEKSDEAERLEVVATKASKKPGRATFHDDYRRQDVRALTLRERVGRETARRLYELGDDDTALRDLIHSARESALDDVIQARISAVMPYRRDPAYRRERNERMRALADDLAVLRRRQKARLGDRVS